MFSRIGLLVRDLRQRNRFEAGMSDEILAHIDARAHDLMSSRGLSREQAARQARLEFGGFETMRDECRRSRGLHWFDEVRQDLRYAFRTLANKPGFTASAILMLAFGIGANSAMFSVMDSVLLRTLPVAAPGELYSIAVHGPAEVAQRYSWPFAKRVFDATGAYASGAAMSRTDRVHLGVKGDRRVETHLVSGEWFSVLGIQPSAGRFLTQEDNRTPGGHPVIVVSHQFWSKQFGEKPFSPGQTVLLRQRQFEIIGVGPKGFNGVIQESPVDVWAPLMMQQDLGYFSNFQSTNAEITKQWAPQETVRWLDIWSGALLPCYPVSRKC
ncbi:MAG: ABC transporter permease [Bryobacteraceae bacterium]|nr:ABC transporter permease [Bryobacteraceae bacterium]